MIFRVLGVFSCVLVLAWTVVGFVGKVDVDIIIVKHTASAILFFILEDKKWLQ